MIEYNVVKTEIGVCVKCGRMGVIHDRRNRICLKCFCKPKKERAK